MYLQYNTSLIARDTFLEPIRQPSLIKELCFSPEVGYFLFQNDAKLVLPCADPFGFVFLQAAHPRDS